NGKSVCPCGRRHTRTSSTICLVYGLRRSNKRGSLSFLASIPREEQWREHYEQQLAETLSRMRGRPFEKAPIVKTVHVFNWVLNHADCYRYLGTSIGDMKDRIDDFAAHHPVLQAWHSQWASHVRSRVRLPSNRLRRAQCVELVPRDSSNRRRLGLVEDVRAVVPKRPADGHTSHVDLSSAAPAGGQDGPRGRGAGHRDQRRVQDRAQARSRIGRSRARAAAS